MRTSTFTLKHLSIAFATIVAALAIASTARADERTVVVAKVPFPFIVGEARLPAGNYIVKETADLNVVEVVAADGGRAAFAITIPTVAEPTGSNSELVFKKFDGQYFLARVQPFDGDEREIVLTPSIMAQEIAKVRETSHTADMP